MLLNATLFNTRRSVAALAASGALALTMAGTAPAQAQAPGVTLSLSPSIATVSAGQSVVFTVLMSGGSNIGGYDFTLSLGSPDLQFAPAGFTFDPTSGLTFLSASTISGSTMEVSAGLPLGATIGFTPQTATPLGTFQVTDTNLPAVQSPTPAKVSFIAPNGSQVFDFSGINNELTTVTPATLTLLPAATPEPSGLVGLASGATGLGLLAWRKRRAA